MVQTNGRALLNARTEASEGQFLVWGLRPQPLTHSLARPASGSEALRQVVLRSCGSVALRRSGRLASMNCTMSRAITEITVRARLTVPDAAFAAQGAAHPAEGRGDLSGHALSSRVDLDAEVTA